MESKEIKVYGTLVNHTTIDPNDSTLYPRVDSQHNDSIAYAYQLYDDRFDPKKGSGSNGTVIATDKYQDIINKRLTAISYDPNSDITNIYSNLYVDGDTNIGGDLTVEGDTTFEGDVNITGDVNLNIGLDDLNDVTLSTMAIGQVLRYNGSGWVNAKLSIDDLEMPSATAGLVLKFNGTKWVADTDETGDGGATKLSELSDVDSSVDSATNGQVLKFNGTKWVAGTDETGGGSNSGTSYNVVKRTGEWITLTSANDTLAYIPHYSMSVSYAEHVASALCSITSTSSNDIDYITSCVYTGHVYPGRPSIGWYGVQLNPGDPHPAANPIFTFIMSDEQTAI